ncbi:UNVERIFIED_CONTAM: hypothetical protein K2H54_054410 [Gekko kuhli]
MFAALVRRVVEAQVGDADVPMAIRGAEFAGPSQGDAVNEDRDNGDKQERGLVCRWQQNRKFLGAQEEDAGLANLRDRVALLLRVAITAIRWKHFSYPHLNSGP